MERELGKLLDDYASANHWYKDRTGNATKSIKTRGYDDSVELYVADTAPYTAKLREKEDYLALAIDANEQRIIVIVDKWLDKSIEEWNNG
jgi:hypothetical protein